MQQQGALARTVGSDQSNALALPQFHVHAADCFLAVRIAVLKPAQPNSQRSIQVSGHRASTRIRAGAEGSSVVDIRVSGKLQFK
jgi:hypothetical protein